MSRSVSLYRVVLLAYSSLVPRLNSHSFFCTIKSWGGVEPVNEAKHTVYDC